MLPVTYCAENATTSGGHKADVSVSAQILAVTAPATAGTAVTVRSTGLMPDS